MTDRIPPPTFLVTAYKAHDNATQRGRNVGAQGSGDRFGPAVTSHLSSATQGAMEQAAKSTDTAAYDRHGRTQTTAKG